MTAWLLPGLLVAAPAGTAACPTPGTPLDLGAIHNASDAVR